MQNIRHDALPEHLTFCHPRRLAVLVKMWEEVLHREDEVEIRTLMQGLEPAALKEFTALFLVHIQAKARSMDELIRGRGEAAPRDFARQVPVRASQV